MAVKVHSTPEQAFSANFDLQGTPKAGSLTFTSILGSTLARLQWNAMGAELQTSGEPQRFTSLEDLTQQVTGAELPLAQLFAWLQGEQAMAPGWQVDLSALASGRLRAQRLAPYTPADLKIILER